MKLKTISLLFALVTLQAYSETPQFLYDVDYLSYFDNREYSHPFNPQTIFALRLSPTVGLQVTDNKGGTHRLMGGVHYTQPLGGNWDNTKVLPTAYYQYRSNGFSVSMGAIPFAERIEVMPDYLWFDSLAYARPNIQGALLQYASRCGFAEFMCDWHSAQYGVRREIFRILMNGQLQYNSFFVGGMMQMNHKANAAEYDVYEGVCDDIHIVPHAGFNLSQHTSLDSLSVKVSYIYSIQRERRTNTTFTPQGWNLDVYANWRFLGLKNTLYIGENLMPFYDRYGAYLNLGDPFYSSDFYNRTDVFIYLFRNNFANCYFSWNMHYAHNVGLQHQQQLIVQLDLEGLNRKGKLKGLFGK